MLQIGETARMHGWGKIGDNAVDGGDDMKKGGFLS